MTLTCEVTTVRGITSGITIQWIIFGYGEGRKVENVTGNVLGNSVVYRDLYEISRLTRESSYWCDGIINSVPRRTSFDAISLRFTCECYLLDICVCLFVH